MIIQVASVIGGWETIALLVIESAIGAYLLKHQGLATLDRISRAANEGRVPSNELIDGLLLLVAGALMLAPGLHRRRPGLPADHPHHPHPVPGPRSQAVPGREVRPVLLGVQLRTGGRPLRRQLPRRAGRHGVRHHRARPAESEPPSGELHP